MAHTEDRTEGEIAKAFFTDLYGDLVSEEASVVMWSPVRGVDVLWSADIPNAARVALDRAARVDAYFQPCLHSRSLMQAEADKRIAAGERGTRSLSGRRGFHESAVVMPGVWADIDTKEGSHEALDFLPDTTQDVIDMLRRMDCPPAYIINTGGGVHAYWLFDEPWVLESDEDREAARDLNYRWQQGYVLGAMERTPWGKAVLRARGSLRLDSTFDLARVLRVPGTLNRKYDPPRPVMAAAGTSMRRYTRDDLEMYIPRKVGPAPARVAKDLGLKALPEGTAVPAIAAELMNHDLNFQAVWSGRREYASQSERDLAIATIMMTSGATADQALEAMVANRKLRGAGRSPEEKGIRYYESTIGKATEACEAKVELDEVAQEVDGFRSELSSSGQAGNDRRASLLSKIGRFLGLKDGMAVLAIECVSTGGSAARRYVLVTSHGRVDIGPVENLMLERKFRPILVDAFRIVPQELGKKKWPVVVEILLALIEDVELGHDASEAGETQAMLLRWVEESIPASGMRPTNKGEAVLEGLPWIENDKVYISPINALPRIIRSVPAMQKMTTREFAARLRSYGAALHSRGKGPAEKAGGPRRNYDLWELPYYESFWVPSGKR